MLKSENPNLYEEIKATVEHIIYNVYCYEGEVNIFFEHGQWWAKDIITDRTWSVVDAEDLTGKHEDVVDGLSLELVDEGSED